MEIASLGKRGWSISAIARHVGGDRKTVRAYLPLDREPGVRSRSEPDPFDQFEPYVRKRLADDQHVWATTLFGRTVGQLLRAMGYSLQATAKTVEGAQHPDRGAQFGYINRLSPANASPRTNR